MLFGRRFKFNKDRSTGPGKVKIWRNYMRKNYILDTNILISSPNAINTAQSLPLQKRVSALATSKRCAFKDDFIAKQITLEKRKDENL